MRAFIATTVGLAVMVLTGPVVAGEPLTPSSLLGGTYESGLGTYLPVDTVNAPRVGQNSYGLGVAFHGPTTVDSLTITQYRDGHWRRMIQQLDVYANGELVGMIRPEDNQDMPLGSPKNFYTQTVPILALDGVTPITVTATWLTLVLREQHPSPPGTNDGRSAVETIQFNGTPCAMSGYEENLNLNKGFTAAGNYTGPNHSPHGSGSVVLDGQLHCAADNGRSMFWVREDGQSEQSFTVLYGDREQDLQTIGSVGISFLSGHGDRNLPKWVILSDSNENNILIEMDAMVVQYNRYDQGWLLDENGDRVGEKMVYLDQYFIDTEFLKLTFPKWADLDNNWWVNSSDAYGLTEFQAFADRVPAAIVAPVPEPATMVLLLLGGLSMLRRRK